MLQALCASCFIFFFFGNVAHKEIEFETLLVRGKCCKGIVTLDVRTLWNFNYNLRGHTGSYNREESLEVQNNCSQLRKQNTKKKLSPDFGFIQRRIRLPDLTIKLYIYCSKSLVLEIEEIMTY